MPLDVSSNICDVLGLRSFVDSFLRKFAFKSASSSSRRAFWNCALPLCMRYCKRES